MRQIGKIVFEKNTSRIRFAKIFKSSDIMPSNYKISIPKFFLSVRFLSIVILVSCIVSYGSITSAYAQADSTAAAAPAGAAAAPASGAGQADGIPTDEAIISQGSAIFKNNCSVCHAIDAQVVGPALKGINQRRPLPWLSSFIRNSQKVIQGGDEYAVNLYNQFNKTVMPSFDFSDDEIKSVLGYIQSESNKVAAPVADAGGETPANGGAEGADADVSSTYLNIILIGLVIVLILILVVLLLIVTLLNRFVRQRNDLDEEDREYLDQKLDVQKTFKSPAFIGIITFIFLTIIVKVGIDGLYSIGMQQGYQPRQPIAFSHKLHAGQYEIACQYCHTGVMKAKSANIPSPNICMNCHTQIKTESPEIQKIYAAIDYNPEDQSYGTDTKPIEWVRVHNLPDLAYFNHSQHVQVAGLACETCHGDIREMEVVYQYSKLTMGWCINCHRETEVNYKDNAYYDKLIEVHNAENKKGTPMYVSDMGGLECSKCHY